jgi:hypothetical protein
LPKGRFDRQLLADKQGRAPGKTAVMVKIVAAM